MLIDKKSAEQLPTVKTRHVPIMEYLVMKCGIPVLAIDDNKMFVFSDTETLRKAMKEMPLHLKMLNLF